MFIGFQTAKNHSVKFHWYELNPLWGMCKSPWYLQVSHRRKSQEHVVRGSEQWSYCVKRKGTQSYYLTCHKTMAGTNPPRMHTLQNWVLFCFSKLCTGTYHWTMQQRDSQALSMPRCE